MYMHSRLARYGFKGDAHELARRAEAELLPQYEQMDGFKSFSVAVTDDGLFSVTVWESAAQAEAASTTAATWVNGSGFPLEMRDLQFAELILSTTLGVGTTAAA